LRGKLPILKEIFKAIKEDRIKDSRVFEAIIEFY
jgi:hypothetical protein